MCLFQLDYWTIAKGKACFLEARKWFGILINILDSWRVKILFENSTLFCFVAPQWNFVDLDPDSAKVILATFIKKEFAKQPNDVFNIAREFCILIGGQGAGFMHWGITF